MDYEPGTSWLKTVAKGEEALKLEYLILYYQLQHIFFHFIFFILLKRNWYQNKFKVYNVMTSHIAKWLPQSGSLSIYHFN